MEKHNKQIIKRYFEEIWNAKNWETAKEIVSDRFITRFNSENNSGADGLINVVKERYQVFPDLYFELEDMVEEGNKIWVKYIFTGTHKGEFWNIPASGRKIEYKAVAMFEIEEGKVISGASVRDELTLLEQIGFIEGLKKDGKQ